MKFVHGYKTLDAIARFLESEKDEIAIAVAFWGGDAKNLLRIENWKAKRIRIICDATSGACNPQALSYLRTKLGKNLFANSRLHAKVYWTPKRVMITSANASASGLSLEDTELDGNIEAGIITSSPDILKAAKIWFEKTLKLKETVEVNDAIMDQATKMWKSRRVDRPSNESIVSITAALRDKAVLKDRNIVVCNYRDEGRDEEGNKQHLALQEGWARGQVKPPVSIGKTVEFSCIDDYQEQPESLRQYPWSSWVIDLTDPQLVYWYVSDKTETIVNSKTVTIPIYGAKRIPLGGSSIPLTKKDFLELKRRWKSRIGKKNDEWVPLADLAD